MDGHAAAVAAPPGARPEDIGGPPAPRSFWTKYVFSVDHKVIGLQYLFTGLLFFFVAGLLAMAIRYQLAWPWREMPILGRMTPEQYNGIITTHGTLMLIFFILPTLVGAFGNYLVPLQIGARDMAFPVLNAVSYWLIVPGGILMVGSLFAPGGAASSGWTMYPPLSTVKGAVPSHLGQILWVLSIVLVGTSSILGGVNFVATVMKCRAPGMTLLRMPLTCWAYLTVSTIILLGTPVIAAALIMVLLDQTGLTMFFTTANTAIGDVAVKGSGGQPLLYQHLFWFYSHPVVYLMILPGIAMVADIISTCARKPAFGFRASIGAMLAIVFLGFLVWGHHIYVSGMNPYLGVAFSILTAAVGVPSGVLVFNILATLWKGSIRLTAGMLSAVGVLIIFVTGGITGLINAMSAIDIYVHDTYWVVAHFHFVVGGASVFAVFAAINHWYPKMFGRHLHEGLAKAHVALSFVGFYAIFFTMHVVGIGGMHRRIADPMDYEYLKPMKGMQIFITVAAFAFAVLQLLFVANFVGSLFKGRKAAANPWEATTLEWAAASPPEHHNFDAIPEVHRWAYEYSPPGEARDFVPQWEPAGTGEARP
jgi:cytochrome c oxidase subunit 1